MSSQSPASSGSERTGWRGRRAEAQRRAQVQHGWQQRGPDHPTEQLHKRRVRTRLKVLLVLLGCAVLLGGLLYAVLHKPQQTPVLYIAPTGYRWPLPPTSMASEDKRGLKDLADPSQKDTLDLVDISDAWNNRDAGLEALRENLQQLSSRWNVRQPIVVYLCLHGVSDQNGRPYLLTPDASPTDVGTWLPFESVLQVMEDVMQGNASMRRRPKLLVLDSSRMPRNWSLGVLRNRFDEGVQQLIRDSRIPNLAVLNSVSPGERAYVWRERQASVFGHFLRSGLAGAAVEGGGYMTVRDLERYLARQVDDWARRHRDSGQRPVAWFSPGTADFQVAHGIRGSLPAAVQSPQNAELRQQRNEFWQVYDEMRELRVDEVPLPPTQTALLAWHDFEHRLMWLEQLIDAGEGYRVQVLEVQQELANAVKAFRQQRDLQAAAFDRWSTFDTYSDDLPAPRAHSLPLQQYFGLSADAQRAGRSAVREALDAAADQPTRERLQELNRVVSAAVNEQDLPPLIEGYLPEVVARYWMPGMEDRAGQIGSLLEVRDRVERLASPSDLRLIRWLRPELERVDAERRRAEDLLFTGGDELDEQLARARAVVERLEEREAILSDAYLLRDRCWAELPYLAFWFTRPDPHLPNALQAAPDARQAPEGSAPAQGDKEIAAELTAAIEQTHALDELLAADVAGSGLVGAVQSKAAEVRDAYNQLRDRFAGDFRTLDARENLSAGAVRDMDRMLALPLLSQSQRAGLEERRLAFQAPAESDEPVADDQRDRTFRNMRWEGAHDHPALLLAQAGLDARATAAGSLSPQEAGAVGPAENDTPAETDTPAEVAPADGEGAAEGETSPRAATDSERTPAPRVGDQQRLGGQEAALRDHLARLPLLMTERSTRDNLGPDRAGWRQAERLLRPCAALLAFERTLRQNNPLNSLRRFHLQRLLLWQAERGLADLSPLGEQLADRYVQAARAVGALPQADSDEFLELSRGVARFGTDGLRVDTQQLLLPVDNANLRAVVQQTQPLPVSPQPAGAAVGHATLFVRDSRGDVVNARPRAIALPRDSEATPYELQMALDPDRSPSLYTVLMFRGREYVEDFLPETIGGFRVAFEPPVYDRAQVTLRGYRSRRASIIFVLDCSYSMRQTIPGEQQDDPRARMEIAKSKLQEMLQQLARQDDVRVGVYFFGHRRGWSRENPNEAITQDGYAGADLEQLESLHPGEDVEEVLPLGRFGPLIAERVIDKLETVVGWGQTPLYLALEQAQQAFAADDPDTDKSIVVITDGRNYQFAPPNNPLGPLNTTGIDEVLEAWRQYRAKVHIVSLALQAEDVAEVEREFERLAEQTGGRYMAARNASSLIRDLRSLLGPARYRLEDLEGREVGVRPDGTIGPALLEEPLIIRPTPSAPTDYILQHDQLSRRIEVSPGDALELRVAGNGQYIEAIPFDDNGLAAQAGLVQGRGGAATPLVVRAHPPVAVINEERVRFQVSVQRKDLEVTSRPAEAWVEITPLAGDQATELEPTYFFYDANFLANQPVPLLAWDAFDWPFDEARYARVRFWCKPVPTPVPDEGRIALRDILSDPDTYAALRDVSNLAPGVRVRVEARETPGAFRIDVVEMHEGPDPDMGALKIVVATDPNAPLERVSRQFDRDHGIAIHSFFFPASAGGVFRRSQEAELQLIPGSLVKSDAWQLPSGEALDVEVSSDTDTLRPGPLLSAP